MRLYVYIITSEKLLCSFNGKVLNNINILASAVVSFSGLTFGIFVGKPASHCCDYSLAEKIF